MKKKTRVLLGVGTFGWDGSERRTDRYGAITLCNEDSWNKTITKEAGLDLKAIKANVGKKGALIFEVTQTRKSTHIGDFFRGIFPTTPKVGAKLKLGIGTLFTDKTSWCDTVGLFPEDGRDSDWLNAKKLYRAHEQTGKLFFEEI